jgi:hypothetical protein
MAEVDGGTLMMAIQAVRDKIARLESLLQSETLRDAGAIQDLLMSFDRAAEKLKVAYEFERRGGRVNLPPYEDLVRTPGLLPE